jgi:hypothetical protein
MFGLADVDRTRSILEKAGWHDVAFDTQQRTVTFGGGGTLDATMDFLLSSGPGRALFGEAAPAEPEAKERGIAAVRDALAEHLTPRGVEVGATSLLITARR